MAKSSESSKSTDIAPIGNLTVTIRNNNSTMSFNVLLNSKNYNTWLKMMMLHASGEGKCGYLTGKVAQVIEEDLGFDY